MPGSAILRCCSASTPAGVTMRHRDLKLVLHARDDIALAIHHRLESDARDFGGIRLVLLRADLRIHQIRALEELGIGDARHETGHGHARVLELIAKRPGERIDERFRAVVDRLIGAGHEAGNRSGEQDAPLVTAAHVLADAMNQVKRAGDVGIDDMRDGTEVLIEKAPCRDRGRRSPAARQRARSRSHRIVSPRPSVARDPLRRRPPSRRAR